MNASPALTTGMPELGSSSVDSSFVAEAGDVSADCFRLFGALPIFA